MTDGSVYNNVTCSWFIDLKQSKIREEEEEKEEEEDEDEEVPFLQQIHFSNIREKVIVPVPKASRAELLK